MSFYKEWKETRCLGSDDKMYFDAFINKKEESLTVLQYGTEEEVAEAVNLLTSIATDEFWKHIPPEVSIEQISSKTVPQYSSLDNCLYKTPEILEFYEDGLGLLDLGRYLNGEKSEGAMIKYGENHSQTAECFCLVNIIRKGTYKIKISALGSYMNRFSREERQGLFCRMILRELIIQTIIRNVLDKKCLIYNELVGCLAQTTRYRRRTGIMQLTKIAFMDGTHDCLYNYINWECAQK